MKPSPDWPERLLALTSRRLPPGRRSWGAAMRAELAAIEEPDARSAFARSAARASFARGLGVDLVVIGATVATTAGIVVSASRLQLPQGGPGVLGVTVLIVPLVLLVAGVVLGHRSASRPEAIALGLLTTTATFLGLIAVLTIEGTIWMDRHGVFILDGDPPRHPVNTTDIMLDIFTTGMWIPHVLFWLPTATTGALLGTMTHPPNARPASSSL